MNDVGIGRCPLVYPPPAAWMRGQNPKIYLWMPEEHCENLDEIAAINMYSGKIITKNIVDFCVDQLTHESGHTILNKIGELEANKKLNWVQSMELFP